MRIAEVAPLWENVPPAKYGGIEMGVSLLTEGLIKKGHQVTLFAAGTAKSKAELVAAYPKPLCQAGISWDNFTYPYLNYMNAFLRSSDFDIIHIHPCLLQDYLAMSVAKLIDSKVLFTMRSILPFSQKKKSDVEKMLLLKRFADSNFVSISQSQRQGWESLNWVANIYNGIEIDKYPFKASPEDYLLWVGKIRPEKGVEDAIEVAKATGNKLIIAGPIDENHEANFAYWKEKIEPAIDGDQIAYLGEVDREKVAELFTNAKAFINPIHWSEAFGLVMAESQSCGTPVIVYDRGSARELVKDGETGFVVNNLEEMIAAVRKIEQIDRKACHNWASENFSAKRMIDEYEALYMKMLIK